MILTPTSRVVLRAIGLGVGLLLMTGCVAGGPTQDSTPTLTPPPTPTSASASGDASSPTSFVVDGRSVLVHVPASAPNPGKRSLLMVLHGYTGNATETLDYFGLPDLADERGFVVAAPQGTLDRDGKTFWNASGACCNFYNAPVDDSAFLSQVIATAVAELGVDPDHVFVVGHSNGGFMALRLACEHADQVAAVASLAGAMDGGVDCEPSQPVSVLQVHGDADLLIRYAGGEINGRTYTSAAGTVSLWRDAGGCGLASTSDAMDADALIPGDDLTATTWSDCRDDSSVALWTIAGGSHVPDLTPTFAGALADWFEAHGRT
ncbi:MAG TPA: alpha/beta fold hydrolase [Propionibacteriaceae bacterium]|nr:alpha/beta fold hydrolase [Propionibacteriaceae bacterium]